MAEEIKKEREKAAEKKYLVDMLLDTHPAISSHQFATNIFLFFIAGHETTASTLTWALHVLARRKDIQERVQEEVDRVLKGNSIDASQIKELTYMEMFLKEVLRWSSIVAIMVTRETAKDVTLNGYFIPKGTAVGLGIQSVHHNPEFWAEPEQFNPDRFDPVLQSKQHPYAYLPFSLGKRACIGNTFSIASQKVYLATLLQQFNVSRGTQTGDKVELSNSLLTRCPLHEKVLLERRK